MMAVVFQLMERLLYLSAQGGRGGKGREVLANYNNAVGEALIGKILWRLPQ
jgi:hypothetical protein